MLIRFLRGGALACALLLVLPAKAGPEQPDSDAAAFAARPVFADPMLAPDGRRIAARGVVDGEPRLLIVDLAVPGRARTPLPLPDGFVLDGYRWAGSGRLIVGLAQVAEGPSAAEPVRLVSIELATGRRTAIAPAGEVIHVDPAGGFVLVSANRAGQETPAVYRVDLATGAAAQVVAPQKNVWDWAADSAGVVRTGTGYKGASALMLYRSADGQAFRRLKRGAAGQDSAIRQTVPVRGTDQGYALAESPRGRVALFRYDFRDSRLGALVYEDAEADLDGFQTGADGKVQSVSFTRDRDETRWFDPVLGAVQAQVDAGLPDRINRIVSTSDDRARALVFSRSPTQPGAFYLYERDGGRLDPLAEISGTLAGRQLAAMQTVRYRARDGLEIRGYLTLPPGRDPARLPLVVMPHGGPFARDDWGFDPWVQYLAAKGYAVLQPNYRGSTGYGRDFVARGDGEWGRGMQDDVDDGVAWLAGQGTVDPKRVCIMGASYGGYAAMWAAAKDTDRYRCAISFAGISDVGAQLAFDRKSFDPRFFRKWRKRIQGNAPSLEALSPLTFVDRMTMPMLIGHGLDDDTVPAEQSAMLHEALAKRGRAHEYVTYAHEGHNLDAPAATADFLTRVGAFLKAHNPS